MSPLTFSLFRFTYAAHHAEGEVNGRNEEAKNERATKREGNRVKCNLIRKFWVDLCGILCLISDLQRRHAQEKVASSFCVVVRFGSSIIII